MRQDRRGEEAGRRQAVSRALRAVTRVLTDALWLLLGNKRQGFLELRWGQDHGGGHGGWRGGGLWSVAVPAEQMHRADPT